MPTLEPSERVEALFQPGWTCPNCEAIEPGIETLEVLNGYAGVTVLPDGSAQWDGSTDMDWDSSTTMEYRCFQCAEPLPEDWQQELDRRLGNHRYEITSKEIS